MPLAQSVEAWRDAVRFWSRARGAAGRHLESFAGCMMGQLCPPSMLVALGLLEGLFFAQEGIQSLSLSYAQGTHHDQDVGALLALDRLAAEYLGGVDRHLVLYTFMGLFPETPRGARALIEDSARIAVEGGAARVIVKTAAEARQIPSVEDNLQAMAWVRDAARRGVDAVASAAALGHAESVLAEARLLVEATLELDPDVGKAIVRGFGLGLLDVPFCIHPDNRNLVRPSLREDGVVGWQDVGNLPLGRDLARRTDRGRFGSRELMEALSFNRRRFDAGRED